MFNVFEQFSLVGVLNIGLGYVSNSSLIILLSFVIVLMLCQVWMSSLMIPSYVQFIWESISMLLLSMVNESVNRSSYMGPFLVLFTVLLSLNLISAIPYSYAVTANLIVCLFLSTSVWLGNLLVGLYMHGFRLFSIFLPSGLPFIMTPFFVIVELIGFIVPVISLALRLFANILSGHVLLKVLFSFTALMWSGGLLSSLFHVFPLGLLFILLGLEIAVAIIQAYVFVLLSCIYVGDMINPSH